MNKKIKSEIAIGIILIIALVIGGIIWLGEKKQNKKALLINSQIHSSQEKNTETNKMLEDNINEPTTVKNNDLDKKEILKTYDYEIRNLKIDPITPRVNEHVKITFELYNNGQADLYGGGYDIELSDANMIPDKSNPTCSESKIISPRTSCIGAKEVSYSTAGIHTIKVTADRQEKLIETDEQNNSASIEFKVKPDATVVYPNGKEVLRVGQKYRIKWNIGYKNVSKVQLAIFNSSVNGVVNISEQIDGKQEYFDWVVPSFDELPGIGGKDYKLRLINWETGDAYDESNSEFSIIAK